MARTGLYKSEVKKARDTLVAQGKHPSVDAVRIELGNTGSKTTIHKYLKELEEEGSTDGRKVSISETLQDLVARLAAQLQEEASAQTEAMRAQQAEQERHHADALSRMEKAIEAAQSELSRIEVALQEEKRAHAQTRDTLQHETVVRHTAEQQVHDLKDRLAENESHRQSLEEKHQHARESLEHYRQSVKDQRDQDQRRHEQQIQQLQAELRTAQQAVVVKQEEVTRLNQDGARLVADLSHAKKALYDEQSRQLQLEQKLQAAQAMEHRCKSLDEHLNAKSAELRDVQKQLDETTVKTIVLSDTVHDLQVALAAANAKLEAQHEIAAQLRAYMEANANLGVGK